MNAVYEEGNLYFDSFYTTRRFLDIKENYERDLEADTAEFLRQAPVAFEGDKSLFETAGLRSRERMSRILRNKVWETVDVEEICNKAGTVSINIDTRNDGRAIFLPSDPARLGQVLKFLDQAFTEPC